MTIGRTILLVVASAVAASPAQPCLAQAPAKPADLSQRLPVRGVVRPAAQAVITSDLSFRVTRVAFKDGQRFKAGDVLIEFDCARLRAELASAEAMHREMSATHASAALLEKRSAGSRLEVEITEARVARANAEADAIRARLAQCTFLAPFDGSVVERSINEHETPSPGKPLLSIVSVREPEIELIVPSSWLTWIRVGGEFEFRVEETKQVFPAIVVRLGAAADAVSQTMKVYARFKSQTPNVLPGHSGTASFPPTGS